MRYEERIRKLKKRPVRLAFLLLILSLSLTMLYNVPISCEEFNRTYLKRMRLKTCKNIYNMRIDVVEFN